MAKSSTGLKKNTSAALSYVLGPITGVIFLVIDKDPFVRFHAMQSIVVFVGLFILQTLMSFTLILLPFVTLVWVIQVILWVLLIYKAWNSEEWEVPFFGKYARKFLKRA